MPFYLIGGTLIGLFALFFVFGYICFCRACKRRKKYYVVSRQEPGGAEQLPKPVETLLPESRRWLDEAGGEAVTVTAHDGLRLAGRLLLAEGTPRGLVLMFHGYHSSCRRDLAIQARFLHEAGYHLLLASQRAHGESEGTYICFGAKERRDVASWCCFALRRPELQGLPFALFGLSLGASTVLMSSNIGLPEQVKCIVGDCGFSGPWDIIKRTIHQKHRIYPYPVIYFMNFWSRCLAKFDFREASVSESLRECTLPVLLIHGEEDRYVPTEMSHRAAAANPRCVTLWTVPHARHAQAVFYEPDAYRTRVLAFLEETM